MDEKAMNFGIENSKNKTKQRLHKLPEILPPVCSFQTITHK
jgi:hypothetical protein